jgi:hypothetical protein
MMGSNLGEQEAKWNHARFSQSKRSANSRTNSVRQLDVR